jgi:hypothetical protein
MINKNSNSKWRPCTDGKAAETFVHADIRLDFSQLRKVNTYSKQHKDPRKRHRVDMV